MKYITKVSNKKNLVQLYSLDSNTNKNSSTSVYETDWLLKRNSFSRNWFNSIVTECFFNITLFKPSHLHTQVINLPIHFTLVIIILTCTLTIFIVNRLIVLFFITLGQTPLSWILHRTPLRLRILRTKCHYLIVCIIISRDLN